MNSDNIFYSKQIIYEVATQGGFEEIESIYFKKSDLNYLNLRFFWVGQKVYFKLKITNLNGNTVYIEETKNLKNSSNYVEYKLEGIDISSLSIGTYYLKIYLKKNEPSVNAFLKELTVYLTGE